ncbi:hypothetical protein Droror1_Dr00002726 [Drosera rotundifolia]
MATMTRISLRTVVSTMPVQLGRLYPLSVLDRLMENHHIRIVHYYKSLRGTTTTEVASRMRETIMETLMCFPIMTGRLVRSEEDRKWMIKCNDCGVRIVESSAQGSVESWLQSVDQEKELQLAFWEDMHSEPYYCATFYVQITAFEEGGLALGLSCSHLLADPISSSLFLKSWADVSLTGKVLGPPFFYPLPQRRPINTSPAHKSSTHLINRYRSIKQSLNPSPNLIPIQKFKTITLSFTEQMVQACIDLAKVHDDTPAGPSPSPFQALVGLLWACISKAKGMTDGLMDVSICVDTRKVLGLDKGFFGNCMVYSKLHGENIDVTNISQAAKATGDAMSTMDNNSVIDLIEWLEENDDQMSPPASMDGHDLVFVNLESVDAYSVVFGQCEEPLRVSCYVTPVNAKGKVVVLPSPGAEGPLSRVAMVTLPEDEAARLCEDPLISKFSRTLNV